MTILYNIIIGVFWFGIKVASLFSKKIRKFTRGRKNIFLRLKQEINPDHKIVWFHAASLGEFEQGRPVIEALRVIKPEYKILLTFFSPSGYEIRYNYKGADYIYYLPLDFSWNAKRFIDMINPVSVYFIKYEFWYNFVRVLKKRNIPIFCFSANFRPGQLFFKWYGFWYRRILNNFSHFFVQNSTSKELLAKINLNNVTISGDTRFDRVTQIAGQSKQLPLIQKFKNNKPVVVAGSTWPADESLLIEFINQSDGSYKFIIAPHEIHSNLIEQLIKGIELKTIKYSEASETDPVNFDVMIIDNIGLLSSVYNYGNIAYIGGGFGKGIHNILEAATFGLPVIFGPNYHKFHEAKELIIRKGAFSINDFISLKDTFNKLFSDETYLSKSGNSCKDYVRENTGATMRILEEALKISAFEQS
jgi:3-deoxy-D-manno-octulosonic-acid transferase